LGLLVGQRAIGVAKLDRDFVPAVLAADPALGVFAMEYLPTADFEPWKSRLEPAIALNFPLPCGKKCCNVRAHAFQAVFPPVRSSPLIRIERRLSSFLWLPFLIRLHKT